MPSSSPSTRSAPFTIEEFNQLVSNALDLDRVPLPLLDFIPPKSKPDSLEWTAHLDSYVDDEQDILALNHPLLNLHNMSRLDISPPPPSPNSFFHRVRSRASTFVRRGGKHDMAPSPSLLDDVSTTANPSHPDVPRKSFTSGIRKKPLPLSFLHIQSSRAIPPISAPTNVQRPSFQSSHSFFESRDDHYPFSMPSMTPPTTPSRPRKIAVPLRKSKSQYSSPLEQSTFGNIPPSPSKCGPCLIQHTPPSRSPSPYTCPRTPPLPTPPLTASYFPGPPSADYLNTRRGSNTSTSSSTSSMLPPPSVRSTASTLTSRLSTSLSFPKLASNPFSRSKSRLCLTLDTSVVSSNSMSNYSPLTPQTPSSFLMPAGERHLKHVDFTSFDQLIERPVPIDRVLTPEADPFARVDGNCSDTRSETPTIHRPTILESKLENYSFPPNQDCPYQSQMTSELEGEYRSIALDSPPPSPPLSRLPPRCLPGIKPLPPTPNHPRNKKRLPDWTLCLPDPTTPRTRTKQQPPASNRSKPTNERVRFSSTPARPGSPFPFARGLSTRTGTPPDLKPRPLPNVRNRSRSTSVHTSSEIQSDEEWPLPPRRTVVVVLDSDTEGEETKGNNAVEKTRSPRLGWHDVEPVVEYFSPKTSPQLLSRRHSVRFPRRSRNLEPGSQLLPPPASAPGHVETFSLETPISNSLEGPLPSPTSRNLTSQQLQIIAKTFGAMSPGQFSGDNTNLLDLQQRTSFESMASRFTNRTRSKTSDSSASSFYTAKSSLSSIAINGLEEDVELPVPYSWKGVQVINVRGHWDFWLLGLDGFFDGQEGGEAKIFASSWSELMDFCTSHQRVVIGRSVSTSLGDDPVVLRVRLAEREQGISVDGMELTFTLEKVSNGSAKEDGTSTLLAFQLPTPTTFREVARLCKKGSVGQGVRRDA